MHITHYSCITNLGKSMTLAEINVKKKKVIFKLMYLLFAKSSDIPLFKNGDYWIKCCQMNITKENAGE